MAAAMALNIQAIYHLSSIPCVVPQPVSFDMSRVPETETSGKDMDSEAEVRPRAAHQK